MPLRSPAARFQRKRWGAALLLLLTALVTNSGAARAAEFVDAAGRRVMLPEPIERVMPASPTAEVLVFVLAPQKIAALSGPARRGGVAGHRVPVLSWRPGMGPESMAATARRLHPDLIIDAGLVTPESRRSCAALRRSSMLPRTGISPSAGGTSGAMPNKQSTRCAAGC